MQTRSKPAGYLGDQKPSLPDSETHTSVVNDYVFSPENYLLTTSPDVNKPPHVRIKKSRLLQRDKTAEEDS